MAGKNCLRMKLFYTAFFASFFRWLLLNDTDPEHELSWLVAQLQDSEIKGEKVGGVLRFGETIILDSLLRAAAFVVFPFSLYRKVLSSLNSAPSKIKPK